MQGQRLHAPWEGDIGLHMFRTLGLLRFAVALSLFAPLAVGEEPAAAQELRELRSVIEQQAKQIEALTQQVAKLAHLLEENPVAPPAPVPAAEPAPAPPPEVVAVKPEVVGRRHIVLKGETLTSIAKQYTVPLAELTKANKDVNDRKLQIGQQLVIPQVAATKSPENTDKKEKP